MSRSTTSTSTIGTVSAMSTMNTINANANASSSSSYERRARGRVPALVAGWWRGLTDAQRRLILFGLFTFATGIFHLAVWLAAGAPALEGPVTWRKPITFGLSIAVAAWSLAWVIRFLPSTPGLTRTSRAVVWLTLAELGLIDMQQWRGVASHFNSATTFDLLVFNAMGLIIVLVAIIIGLWTWQLLTRGVADGRPERLLAARAGMLLMSAGNVLGVFLAVWGSSVQAQTGHVPATFGAAGNVKLTHAVALHGMQMLPVLAVVLGAAIADGRLATRLMRVGVAGYTALLGFVLLQAFTGRAPLDVTPISGILLAVAIAGLAWPALRASFAVLPLASPRACDERGDPAAAAGNVDAGPRAVTVAVGGAVGGTDSKLTQTVGVR